MSFFKKIFYFFIILLFSTLCLIFFTRKTYNWKYAFLTTGAVIKNFASKQNFFIKNYPCKTSLFYTHAKLLSKINFTNNKEYLTENIAGFKIHFFNYLNMHVLFNEIFIQKGYYFKTDKKNPLIIDCGANIGIASLFFKKIYPDSKIIAFEPVEKNFKALEKNIHENKLSDIILVKKALSDKKEKIKLYNPGSLTGSLISNQKEETQKFELVETDLLSNYINQKVDFLKMDIEGAENQVIEELTNSDKLHFIDQMVIEYHYNKKDNNLSKLLKNLEDKNFAYIISSDIKPPFEKKDDYAFLIYVYKI